MTFAMKIAGAACAAALAVSAPAAQAQQTMTEAQIQTVKTEAAAAVEKYYQFFRDHDMKALPEQSFHIPWILLSGQGPQAKLTKEQALADFEGSLKGLIASGWGKSVYTVESVCALNASAAIVSGYNTRYKTDGAVMSVGGVAYILSRGADGWKIASYTSVPRGKLVRCD